MIARLNSFRFWGRMVCNLLPLIAFAAAYSVRFSGYFHFDSTDYEPKFYFGLLILTTIVWSVVSDHYGLAGQNGELERLPNLRRVAVAYAVTHLILFSFLFFYRVQTFSRVFLGISAIVLLAGATAHRFFMVRAMRLRSSSGTPARLLVIGTDDFARRVASQLNAVAIPACCIVGFVQLPGHESAVSGAPVIRAHEMDAFVLGNPIDEIVVALAPLHWQELANLPALLERTSAPVRLALDLGAGVNIRDPITALGDLNLASLAGTPLDSLHYLLFKRLLDIATAVLAIALTAPVMALIACAIKLTSPGPVLFIQERVGLNGKLFRMYKFRTMRVAPPADTDTHWTRPGDPHCTRVGVLLRRMSLDELPQFFNVLKGDMSVVGPRPERPHFVRQFLNDIAQYNSRHRLKVGITGWAQVNGLRGDTSIADRVQYDLYYLQNWTLGLDLRIMARTIWSGLFGKNAY